MSKEQIVEITIVYPSRRGFVMLAYEIQQKITEQVGKAVRLEEQQEGRFTVIINGKTVYDCFPSHPAEVDWAEIIKELARYNLPKIKVAQVVEDSNDSNDPDHLQWMNCVCSGE